MPDPRPQFRIGFLLAVELAERGFVGGLLVANQHGRPLEFQCTSPIKPDRTQEILFGPTLRPYVFGDLIGRTLLERVAQPPDLVVCVQPELLELQELVDMPVGLLLDESSTNPDTATVDIGSHRLRFAGGHLPADGTLPVPDDADLREPFERISLALKETLKAA